MRHRGCLRALVYIVVTSGCSVQGVFGQDIGFDFGQAALDLQYTFDPGPGGKVGDIQYLASNLASVRKFDLGGDGFGGAPDTLLDSAAIRNGNEFDFLFAGEVFRLGPNQYRIDADVTGTDIDLNSNAYEASFQSTSVLLLGQPPFRSLIVSGGLSTTQGNGSILVNRPAPQKDWFYVGTGRSNPNDPDEDGVVGAVSLFNNISSFDRGALAAGTLVGSVPDLDSFFGEDQIISGRADLDFNVVPEPATLILLTIGAVWGLRRRLQP